MTVFHPPIALAIVRRSDGQLLTLQGLLKRDLPGSHLKVGQIAAPTLTSRLLALGVSAPRLVFRWQALAGWGGNPRPVSVYEAAGWSGTPTEECSWSTQEEITAGARAALYRRLFEKLASGGPPRTEDASQVIVEAPFAKPGATSCPRCGSAMRLRNRKPREEVSFDCSACASSYRLRRGGLERIPSLGG